MFAPDTVVSDALTMHPKARWVFAAWQLRGCCDCGSAASETLEEVASGYQISLADLLADLNGLFRTDTPVGDEFADRSEVREEFSRP